ncbi:hypothetical protein CMV_015935 [Castanea mollissima]|uniref:Uncharacterized protein n=1 Tax=Castanea mollissima TaxID=60419 RepID=A0A8J4VSJ9_9ROSI|nr:hypothetical protein CMV_015935 [Castanea mollissima]
MAEVRACVGAELRRQSNMHYTFSWKDSGQLKAGKPPYAKPETTGYSVGTKADDDPQCFPLLRIPHLHQRKRCFTAGFQFLSDLFHSCQQSMTQQQPGVCLLPKLGEEGPTSPPKTHWHVANPSLRSTLTLVLNEFL